MPPEVTAKVGLCVSLEAPGTLPEALGPAASAPGATGGPRGHQARPAAQQAAYGRGAGQARTVPPTSVFSKL